MVEVRIPSVGETITEVSISKLLVTNGIYVKIDDIICELDSEKATFEISAEAEGYVYIIAQEGDILKIGDIVSVILPDKKELPIFLIVKCLERNDDYLDLGSCGLRSSDFEDGTQLNTLLCQCAHLKTLILSNEWWVWGGREQWWIRKKSVNQIGENFFQSFPKAVSCLSNLERLICCGEMDSNWNINDIRMIKFLKHLTYLDLRDNNIQNLDGLENLISLEILYINRNRINDTAKLRKLLKLTHLDIHTNKIKTIQDIALLSSLTILDIHCNEINEIIGLENLNKLKEIYINDNKISNINDLKYLLYYDGDLHIEIDNNPFVKEHQLKLLSSENHLLFLKEIFRRQVDNSTKELCIYPIKILMFGNHGSGKSALVNYLTDKTSEGSTHILRIENYIIDEENHGLLPDGIFYDFGGQDFYHGIYQAFVSETALQLILFKSANDFNSIAVDISDIPIVNFSRRYWLGQKSFLDRESGTIAPYIMIQTFAETGVMEARPIDYCSYHGYKKSFFLSLCRSYTKEQEDELDFYYAGRQYFRSFFNGMLRKLQREAAKEEPIWYLDFLKYIYYKYDKNHNPTEVTKILSRYNVKGLSREEELESLTTNLTTLHRHGLVLYYPKIKGLEHIIWLNPQKLAEHIQKHVLTQELFDINSSVSGVIPKKVLEEKLQDSAIVLLLQEQKIIFLHIPTKEIEDQEYIIPNFLPLANHKHSDMQLLTFGLRNPIWVLKFDDFIPFGFINQLICFFGKQPDVKKFWRNQLLFTLAGHARVLIELDFEQLKIKTHIQCLDNSNHTIPERLSTYIYFSILSLYWNIKNEHLPDFNEYTENKENKIKFKELIEKSLPKDTDFAPSDMYISTDDINYILYKDLVDLNENYCKIKSYKIKGCLIDKTSLTEISTKSFQPFSIKQLPTMKNVFVAYSKYDEDYLQEFEEHLVTLKKEGLAVFNCRKIEFGKEWDNEIKVHITNCDIMICLVSVKFLNTDYIMDVEIPSAIAQNKIIVPIIIKACDWESVIIGKYQSPQRGKVVSLDNNLKLLGQIKGYTREERDAFWTDIIKEFRNKYLFQ